MNSTNKTAFDKKAFEKKAFKLVPFLIVGKIIFAAWFIRYLVQLWNLLCWKGELKAGDEGDFKHVSSPTSSPFILDSFPKIKPRRVFLLTSGIEPQLRTFSTLWIKWIGSLTLTSMDSFLDLYLYRGVPNVLLSG